MADETARWDERYRTAVDHPPLAAVTERLADLTPGRAAGLGCGLGRHARWLADRGWEVQASDLSPVAVARAAEADPRTRYVAADARTWEPDGPVDLVLVAYLHLPVADLVTTLRRAAGWLTPGGRLLYVGHAAEDREHGVGRPHEPGIAPAVADLAAAADGLRVDELRHAVGLVHADAVDVVLSAARWP